MTVGQDSMLVDAVMSRQVVSNCECGHPLVQKSGHPCSLDRTPASYFVDLGPQSQSRGWQCNFHVLLPKALQADTGICINIIQYHLILYSMYY